jgi:hypothetical protein
LTGWEYHVSHDLNFSNRPVRTRMPGGVAGERSAMLTAPMPISGDPAYAGQHAAQKKLRLVHVILPSRRRAGTEPQVHMSGAGTGPNRGLCPG